jgi:WD40 repeat protein
MGLRPSRRKHGIRLFLDRTASVLNWEMASGGTATGRRLARVTGLALCAVSLALAAGVSPASAACPNESLRLAQGTTSLPGCRAIEMVSPPQKFTQPALLPSFSLDGERVLTLARAALAETPSYQFYEGDFYVALRGEGGWALTPTSPLDPEITAGSRRWGGAMLFTPELDRWTMAGSTQTQYAVGVTRMYVGGLDGIFAPISPLLVPIDDSGTNEATVMVQNLLLPGASSDLTAVVVRATFASTGYLPGDPRGAVSQPGGDRNSYVAFLDENGAPALQLLARDEEGEVWGGRCGAHLGGAGASFDSGNIETAFTQGAISPDGERIYFSTRPAQKWDEETLEGSPCDIANGLRVLKRTGTTGEVEITEIAPGGGGPAAPGDDLFQAASADGTRVYFLTPRKLTGADTDSGTGPCSANLGASKGCDLYLYDENRAEGDRIVMVSDGIEEANVLNSTTAIAGDGSRAYFVAQGVLTADLNPEGDPAQANEPNLYVYNAETNSTAFIATLSPGDAAGMWDVKGNGFGEAMAVPVHGGGPEDGGDGHIFAFASKAEIDGEDDGGLRDVFRYDAVADEIERISKVAGGTGETPSDAAVNPAWFKERGFNLGEATRWVSEDGELIGFATKEALIAGDTDEATNPYFWEAETLGAAFAPLFEKGGETRPPAIAPEGDQVAFSTAAPLLGIDTDTVEDVYVGRPNGGFPEPSPSSVCQPLIEGSCQGAPAPGPGPVPPSASGPNVKPPQKKPCRKGKVRRSGKCVKKQRVSRKSHRRANRDGRGGA